MIRDDIEGKTDNHIFDWESGNAEETATVFDGAEVVVTQEMLYPRVHPAPMETCGTVASMDPVTGKLTVYSTNQAPHAHRTRLRPGRRHPGAQDPDHLARTSAADSATRSASTPATCWRSSARSSPASR